MRRALFLCLLVFGSAGAVEASLHPRFALLDAEGTPVIESGRALSMVRSCGACHDTAWIEAHNYHAQLGGDEAGPARSGRPFDRGSGLARRWDPFLYDWITSGDDDGGLSADTWLREHGSLHVGGGELARQAASLRGYEMDCLVCHLESPAKAQRDRELRAGRFEWAGTATLAHTDLVEHDGEVWVWNAEAFGSDGSVGPDRLPLRSPSNENCGQCHGVARGLAEPALFAFTPDAALRGTETTGVVVAPTRMHHSGMNLKGRDQLTRPWDVHAERLVQCIDCHFSPNDPSRFRESDRTRPEHLRVQARTLSLGEYLRRPSHDLAKGHAAQGTVRDDLDGTMRRCEDCHDAGAVHEWLPYKERHLQGLLCESCHVPRVEGAARSVTDWTSVDERGEPRVEYRGVQGDPSQPASLVTGYAPVLLQREDGAETRRMAPHNLMGTWYWFDAETGRPVPRDVLALAWYPEGRPAPALLAALDRDGDGRFDAEERILRDETAVAAVRDRLIAAGANDPGIRGEIQPFGTHHGVAPKSWAVRDCQTCHGTRSRLAEPFPVASALPGGAMPTLVADARVHWNGRLAEREDGSLVYEPSPTEAGLYLLGFERERWVDRLGRWALLLVIAGVVLHGGLRVVLASARRARRAQDELSPAPEEA